MIKSRIIAIIASLGSTAALFAVLLLGAPLRPGLPSQLVGQASAGEPDQPPSVESV
jgi:hypothetical protein